MASSPRLRQASGAVPLHHVQGRSCRAAGDIAILRQDFDIPIRPQDKESAWAVPYDQIFDQYVDTDLLDMNIDNTAEGTSSDDLSNLFDVSSSNGSSAAKTSPMPHWEASGQIEPQDGSQQAWSYIGHNVAQTAPQGNLTSIYPESHGRVAASDPGLFSFDQPPTCSPQVHADPFAFSSPSSPNPAAPFKPAKKFNSLPIRGNKKQAPSVIRRTVSKGSFSPKMMRSTPYRTGYQEIWAKRVGAPPLSPPPSTKVPQEEATYGYNFTPNMPNMPYTNPNEVVDLDQQLSLAGPNYQSRSQIQMTPVASPSTQDASSTRSSFHAPNESSNHYPIHELGDALASPPQSGRLPTTSWSQNSTSAFDFGYSGASEYQPDRDSQAWWTPTTTHQPASQATFPTTRTDFLGVSSAASDLATGGLMINCEPSAMGNLLDAHAAAGTGDGAPFSTSSPIVYSTQMFGTTTPLGPPHNSPYVHAPPPHPPTANGHVGIPLGAQPQHITPPSRSPTNSPPTAHHPYAMRSARRDSSQNHTQPRPRSHHRRKSSGHQGAGSCGSAPRPASVGFVNYTPDDSRKILTGVAPSGSSKTKARREKEAAEKRRRLSQAAARAILEAGGDLATLEREGLLCLPETQELLKQAS